MLSGIFDAYHTMMERKRQRPFLEATMAASAMIAIADGSVTFSERMRMDQIIETLDELKVFDPHEAVDLFRDYAADILEHPREGREKCMEAILVFKDDLEVCQLLLSICLAISQVDGEVPLIDQIEIVTLCSTLGIDPKDCGLYIDQPIEEFIK